ncbi:MAG: hypothetical protein H3C49_05920 [Alphaproteobacteria bacterium]|nr:hypothetical protein [Alphaproteobacteria bacterium]
MKPSAFHYGFWWPRLLAAPLFVCMLLVAGCETVGLPMPSWPSRTADYQVVDDPMAAQAVPAAQPGSGAVNCTVGKGAARFNRGWYDFDEAKFTLRDSQRVNVTLRRRGAQQDTMAFQGVFDTAGQKMLFCPIRSGPPDQRIVCGSLYMLEDDLQMGVKRTFDIPDAIRGGTISCAFDRAKMPKL